jgi:hypothetical protein
MKGPPFCLLSMIGRRLLDEHYAPDGYNIGVNNESGGRAERDAPARNSTVCRGYGGAKRWGTGGYSGKEGVLRERGRA